MNKMITCQIIEDDKNTADVLEAVLIDHFPAITITGKTTSVATAFMLIKKEKPDFLLLDVNLEDGTAFELLKKFTSIDFKIIFLTSHSKFAVEAFKFSALDFLLKPYTIPDFVTSIKNVLTELKKENYHLQLEAFFHNYSHQKSEEKKLVLKNLDAVHIINVKDIIYAKSDNNYTTFIIKDEREIVVSKSLKSFENKLIDFSFFRVHQTYLVNLNCIIKFDKKTDSVLLSNQKSLPISQNKKKMLTAFLSQLH